VKIINEEVDEQQTNIGLMWKNLEGEQRRFDEMATKRDVFAKSWKNDKTLNEMHVEVLHLMLRESVCIVENMELDTKWQKSEIKLKIRDIQINKLKEQIMFRDDLIDEARKMMKSAGMNQDLEDERIVQIEDIIYDQPSAGQRDNT
jgi:hypothetical protein